MNNNHSTTDHYFNKENIKNKNFKFRKKSKGQITCCNLCGIPYKRSSKHSRFCNNCKKMNDEYHGFESYGDVWYVSSQELSNTENN